MDVQILLGKNISARRKVLGISQKELAARLNITQDAMTRIENGKIAPKMKRLDDIAAVLKCTVSSLFRTDFEQAHERATVIAEIISTLPEEGQDALVNLMSHAVSVMNTKHWS